MYTAKTKGIWKICAHCGKKFFVRYPCHFGRKACSPSCGQKLRDWSSVTNQYGKTIPWSEREVGKETAEIP